MPNWTPALAVPLFLTACAASLPVPQPGASAGPPPQSAKLEPAPLPHGPYARRGGTRGALELPIPPKMPLGTGAVPVGGGAARGSVVTGFREAF